MGVHRRGGAALLALGTCAALQAAPGGRVVRDDQRKLPTFTEGAREEFILRAIRAECLLRPRPKVNLKLDVRQVPEVGCISNGRLRNPYEFGVKVNLVITAKQDLIVGARRSRAISYDGDTLEEHLE